MVKGGLGGIGQIRLVSSLSISSVIQPIELTSSRPGFGVGGFFPPWDGAEDLSFSGLERRGGGGYFDGGEGAASFRGRRESGCLRAVFRYRWGVTSLCFWRGAGDVGMPAHGSGVPTSWGERGGVAGATETTPSKFAINFLLDSNCRPDIIEAQVLSWRLPSALGRGRASRFSWLLESRGGGCFFAAEGGGIISGETGEWLSLCRVSVRVGDLRILFSGGATGISSCSRGGRGWWTPGIRGAVVINKPVSSLYLVPD